ncbi:hypothetical protein [Rhodopirellula sallentina]|uniref:Putative membrane protein n=1 Tax=Rhodopirellula sallentina SM41 TaxID=1263870 RepID=M5U1U7_9BACT|nr:hypothetical protein [Rhodopirellula sallentina]EMI55234.1 putative membrane protein [Rhodopirellula sallentina SM41]
MLGITIGGLCATWTLAGTWAALIHLPWQRSFTDRVGAHRQQMQPRLIVIAAWLCNLVLLVVLVRHEPALALQALCITGISVVGPMIAWQWSHQRIHRSELQPPERRSIRQILGIAFTVAVAIASFQLAERGLGRSISTTTLILTIAISWLLMLIVLLGRWWGVILFILPSGFAVRLAVVSLVDLRARDSEAQILRASGILIGFYFFATLLLFLMRSSGHRWFGSSNQSFTNRDSAASSNDIGEEPNIGAGE